MQPERAEPYSKQIICFPTAQRTTSCDGANGNVMTETDVSSNWGDKYVKDTSNRMTVDDESSSTAVPVRLSLTRGPNGSADMAGDACIMSETPTDDVFVTVELSSSIKTRELCVLPFDDDKGSIVDSTVHPPGNEMNGTMPRNSSQTSRQPRERARKKNSRSPKRRQQQQQHRRGTAVGTVGDGVGDGMMSPTLMRELSMMGSIPEEGSDGEDEDPVSIIVCCSCCIVLLLLLYLFKD